MGTYNFLMLGIYLAKSTFYWTLGDSHNILNQHEAALQSYSKALENVRKSQIVKKDHDQAKLMHDIGLQFLDLGQLEKAKTFLTNSCDKLRELGLVMDFCNCLTSLGNYNLDQGTVENFAG